MTRCRNGKQYIAITAFIVCALAIAAFSISQAPVLPPEQFAIVDNVPFLVSEGVLYRYEGGRRWRRLAGDGAVKQLLSGEELTGLDETGKLLFRQDASRDEADWTPLSAGYTRHMRQRLLEINENERFSCVSGMPGWLAVLEDGTLLVPSSGEYARVRLPQAPAALSGPFVLTEDGCVFLCPPDGAGPTGTAEPVPVYGGGDIAAISASLTSGECLGLRTDGTVAAWDTSGYFDPLPVSGWEGVASAAQGFRFAVGLTEEGRILFAAHHAPQETAEALAEWRDITRIAVSGTTVWGLRSDGSCLSLEVI